MNYMQWRDEQGRGVGNWDKVRNEVVGNYIPPFTVWLREHDRYLSGDIREAFMEYYYQDSSFNAGDVRYHKIEAAREALAMLYRYQNDQD